MKCELCDCRFSTKEDMMWHLRAHEMYGDDEFAGMGKTKKWTIKKMINKYGVFLQTEGRTVEQKTMHIIYDKNEKPDYSYSDPEYLKIREKST